MSIVVATACTSGIAYMYIAREKLIRAAKGMGHTIHVKTQGTIGTEDELTAEQTKATDAVILAIDTAITGTKHFERKEIVRAPTNVCMKVSKRLIQRIEAELSK